MQPFFLPGNSCRVLIGFLGQNGVNVLNQISDNKARILILNVTIDAKNFILINLYNHNTKNEEVETLNTLLTMMETTDIKKLEPFTSRRFQCLFKYYFRGTAVEVIRLSNKNPLQN